MARAEPTGVPVNPATTGSVTTGSVTTGSVTTGSVTTGSVTTGSGAVGSMSDVAAMVASGPATVSGDSDSMSVSPVGVRASCTGAGPTRARSSLITERATFSWWAMACWVDSEPAHTWGWATWRPVSLGL